MFYYTFTTFDCNFIPRNAEICKVSSETKNVGKAHKYRLNRHLPTYEKIIKNLYSFLMKKIPFISMTPDLSLTPTVPISCLAKNLAPSDTVLQKRKQRNGNNRRFFAFFLHIFAV